MKKLFIIFATLGLAAVAQAGPCDHLWGTPEWFECKANTHRSLASHTCDDLWGTPEWFECKNRGGQRSVADGTCDQYWGTPYWFECKLQNGQ